MTTTKKYDHLNRLLDISSVPSGASAVKFSYSYNDANQRTRRTDSDDSYWGYEYDSLGQVTSGKHYWPDATPIAGQQFEYAYDDIGNRRRTKEGGDASGSGLRTAHYTVNNLNQYTQRDVPGAADIIGIAYPFAPVTVNEQSTYRRGEYYHKELAIDNSSAPVWQSVTNQASYTTETNTATGNLLLPKTPQTFWYDSDGNTLSDFVWTNSWDAENRINGTESAGTILSSGRGKETWSFDDRGRWIQRIAYTWAGSLYVPQLTNRYLWQGKVLVAVLDSQNAMMISFLRGHGISGAIHGVGGAHGILAVSFSTSGSHFCAYDGKGNVTRLVCGSDGTLSGSYDYDTFGNELRVTGSAAQANPMRSATQFRGPLTQNAKYLYRNYEPHLGRWVSRDPVGEAPSPSIYAFVHNDPCERFDVLGLEDNHFTATPVKAPNPLPPGPQPNTVIRGQTDLKKWHAKLSLRGCCPGERSIRLDEYEAKVEYWYIPETAYHEQHHVDDWKAVWNAFLGKINFYTGRCYCSVAKASCYLQAIGLWSDFYQKEYYEKAASYDWEQYGNEINDAYYKTEWQQAANARDTANEAATKKDAECSKICEDNALITP